MTPKKILIGGFAGLVLSGLAAWPAAAQYYNDPYTSNMLPLSQLSDMPDQISNVAVEASTGIYAGRVREIRTNAFGEPTRIGIALRDNRWVWLDADYVRYDTARHMLVSDLSYGQLEDMSI